MFPCVGAKAKDVLVKMTDSDDVEACFLTFERVVERNLLVNREWADILARAGLSPTTPGQQVTTWAF